MGNSRKLFFRLLLGLLVLASCSSEAVQPAATATTPAPEATIFSIVETETASMNWLNLTGLNVEESVWQERLEELCANSI